jgi:hypothetical protein
VGDDCGDHSAFTAINAFAKFINETSMRATPMLNQPFVIGYRFNHLLQWQAALPSTLERMLGVVEERWLLNTSEL